METQQNLPVKKACKTHLPKHSKGERAAPLPHARRPPLLHVAGGREASATSSDTFDALLRLVELMKLEIEFSIGSIDKLDRSTFQII